jgi:hypothetical protein
MPAENFSSLFTGFVKFDDNRFEHDKTSLFHFIASHLNNELIEQFRTYRVSRAGIDLKILLSEFSITRE